MAASNIDGHTLHHVLGDIGYGRYRNDNVTRANLQEMDILIIDEISMVGATLLQKADHRLRDVRSIDKPFGRIRVIACGDFKQLPPVKDKFYNTTPVWATLNLVEHEATTPS